LAIIGALLGVYLVEKRKHEDHSKALKACGGWLIGCAVSGAVQALISILMIALFIWQALK
jgi:uncharacterized protein YqgC (DUF456 family)